MEKTERKHWVNGHMVKGGWFHVFTFAIPVVDIGILIAWGIQAKYIPDPGNQVCFHVKGFWLED